MKLLLGLNSCDLCTWAPVVVVYDNEGTVVCVYGYKGTLLHILRIKSLT